MDEAQAQAQNTLTAQAISPRFRNYTKTKMIDIRSKISEISRYVKLLLSIARKVAKIGYKTKITIGNVSGDFTAAHFEALKGDVLRMLNKELVDLVRKFKSTRSGASRSNNGFKMPIVVDKGLQRFFAEADAAGHLGVPLFNNGSYRDTVAFIATAGDPAPAITSSAQVTALFALHIFYAQLAGRSSVNKGKSPGDPDFKGDHYGQDENMKRNLGSLYTAVSASVAAKYNSDLEEFRSVAKVGGFQGNEGAYINFAAKLGILGISSGEANGRIQYTAFAKGKGASKGKITQAKMEITPDQVRIELLGGLAYVFLKDVRHLTSFMPSDFRFARIQTIISKARIPKQRVLSDNAYQNVRGIVYPAASNAAIKAGWQKYSKLMQQDVSAELARVASVNEESDKGWLGGNRMGEIPSTYFDDKRTLLVKLSNAMIGDGIAKQEQGGMVVGINSDDNITIVQALLTRHMLEIGQSTISRTLQLTKLYRDKGVDSNGQSRGINGTLALANRIRQGQ